MQFKQYFGPALVSALVVLVMALFVVPQLQDWYYDFSFLHAARMQAIQQMQQRPAPTAEQK